MEHDAVVGGDGEIGSAVEVFIGETLPFTIEPSALDSVGLSASSLLKYWIAL